MANTLQKSLSPDAAGASGFLYDERRDFYISPNVTKELWTDVAPFLTTLSNIETRSDLKDPVFKMFEHRNPWQKQQFTVAGTPTIPDNDTGLTNTAAVVTYEGLGAPDASWIGLVCEIWDATKTTKRGVAMITNMAAAVPFWKLMSGTAFTCVATDIAVVIGNAQGEGMESPEPWADDLQVVWNACQIFKTPLQITGTLQAAVLRGESNELARLRSQKSQEHKIQKERTFLFGTRVGGTGLGEAGPTGLPDDTFNDIGRTSGTINGTTGKVRSTYGAMSAVLDYGSSDSTADYQNIFPITEASFKYSDWVDITEKMFQYVPTSGFKRAFCGAGALSFWNKLSSSSGFAGNSGWDVHLGDMDRDRLGFNYRMLETPHGMLQLIPTPVMTRSPYNKHMLVIDDSNIFHAQYRPSKYQTNIKTDNAYDGVKDQYFCDEGIGLQMIESHSVMYIK